MNSNNIEHKILFTIKKHRIDTLYTMICSFTGFIQKTDFFLLIHQLKQLEFKYNKESKIWSKEFILNDWSSLYNKISSNKLINELKYKIDDESKTELDLKYKQSLNLNNKSLTLSYKTNSDLKINLPGGSLYPFQCIAIEYIKNRKSILIGDAVGIGKTIEALSITYQYSLYPSLIICPSVLKPNWNKEIHKWFFDEKSIRILYGLSDKLEEQLYDYYIINYDIVIEKYDRKDIKKENQLNKTLESLKKIQFKSIILDESHYIANRSLRTISILKNFKDIEYKMLLSGTPLLNKPMELKYQLQFLNVIKELGGTTHFVNRYCNPQITRWGMQYGSSNEEELQMKLRNICMIRRLKEDVLKELPEKTVQSIYIEIEKNDYEKIKYKVKEWYDRKIKEYEDELNLRKDLDQYQKNYLISHKHEKLTMAEKIVQLQFMEMETAKLKLNKCYEWIDNILLQINKLVIFAFHIDILESLHAKYKDSSILVRGGSSHNITEEIEKFQKNDNIKLFIGSLKSTSTGIDGLQLVCSNCCFIETMWTPALQEQAEARLLRNGQKNPVNVYYMTAICDGIDTIDEYKLSVLQQKKDIFDKVIEITSLFNKIIK